MKQLYMAISLMLGLLAVSSTAYAGSTLEFEAVLSGAQEVPEVVTDTTGEIKVKFNEALSEAEFRLVVRDGVAVTQAHFHCGRPGLNGPVVIFLFGFVPAGVDVDGKLAEGTLTNAGFLPAGAVACPGLIGRPVNNIASLAFAMRDGLIYANVHTTAHPGGEVRGQLLED